MAADQAAGLRRRRAREPLHVVRCVFESPQSVLELAHALRGRGWTSLLADARGRLFADSPARSLFDWRQQIARGQLHALPLSFGGGWHAPGVRGDEPGLAAAAQGYDCLLIDCGPDAGEWVPLPGAGQRLVLEVGASQAATLHGYALLKTVAACGGAASVALLGDAAACARLQAACEQFLDPAFCRAVHSLAAEGDAIAALAVRMTAEETGRTAC